MDKLGAWGADQSEFSQQTRVVEFDDVSMLVQRRRRWTNIKTTSGQGLVFACRRGRGGGGG